MLGADEKEEEKIRSYMREQAVPSDQGWSTSSESSESSSDQSTMNSPRRVHQQQSSVHANSMTSAMLFANKTPAASQSVLALMQSKSGSRSPTGGLGSPGFIHVHRGQGYSRCYYSVVGSLAMYQMSELIQVHEIYVGDL